MPRCDICHKIPKSLHNSTMTFKHGVNTIGFVCGDCIAERDAIRDMGENLGRGLSNQLEEESREASYGRTDI